MNLPPDIKLTDYIPDWDEITTAQYKDARDRIVVYLQTGIPDLDTSPGSVFGDLFINPAAHLLAALEIANNRMYSDLDLANVAAGTIWNCPYTKRYLDNFGQQERLEQPASGVIQLVFSEPRRYVISEDTKFLFGDNLIFQLADRSAPIIADKASSTVTGNNVKFFKQIDDDSFTVNLSVVGPAGASVAKGDEAATDLAIPELTEVRAIADFDQGLLTTSVSELASNVGRTFYSASLNNRSGAITYIIHNFPEIIGVSPIMSGDGEMLRDKTNILGISEGKADIYVKYRHIYLTTTQALEFVFNPDTGFYNGLLNIGEDVPTFIDSAKRYSSDIGSNIYRITGRSIDPIQFPDLSAGITNKEQLGIEIDDTTAPIVQNSFISEVSSNTSLVNISLTGQYVGSKFTNAINRNLRLNFTTVGNYNNEQVIFGRLQDTTTNEVINVKFRQAGSSHRGVIIEDEEYNNFLQGIIIYIERDSASVFSPMDFVLPSAYFAFFVRGQTAKFEIQYRYDPDIVSIREFINLKDAKAVNVDLIVRNFLTCYVNSIIVNYRVREGQSVDLESAKAEIFKYVNGITYPNVYEPSQIMEILLYYGAEGVQSVQQFGKFYKSLADTYVINKEEITVDNILTSTLIPPADTKGLGVRNINYILDLNNIKFNVKTV